MPEPACNIYTLASGPAAFKLDHVLLFPPNLIDAPFGVNRRIQRQHQYTHD
ncbi:MAG: hypothetical protein JWQ71_3013 [Pedosphaera sp.]|nr:hypothetical protein [Pedosphaera sp.]